MADPKPGKYFMQRLVRKIDELAGIVSENKTVVHLERTAFVFLVLMVAAAPHSIAATQIAWLTGLLFWVIRLFLRPRPKFFKTRLDLPIAVFLIWTIITAVFSYAPDLSLDKLRGAGLFLIYFFVVNNLRNARAVRFLVFTLILSCMVNVLWTPAERIIGRGVEIHGLSSSSPLAKALLWNGDTLLKANSRKLSTPEDLVAELQKQPVSKVEFYRPDFYFSVDVNRADLLTGTDTLETLGIQSWKKSRNWRSQGFYGHYATYAEVLQLITSLVFGLFVAALFRRNGFRIRMSDLKSDFQEFRVRLQNRKISVPRVLSASILFICLLGMSFALLLTVTRASQLAFMFSAFLIVLLSGNRRLLLAAAVIALPVMIGGLVFLQQSRDVGFIDATDTSTTYRETIYREGVELWLQNPRHFFVGVGMDSVKRFAPEWHLYDDGKLPASHFHSMPIQLLVERGLPALLLWLLILGTYLRILLKGLKRIDGSADESRIDKGIILGCLGGAVGFFVSGMVHYNLGDAEVAMVFFILMGFGVFTAGKSASN